MVGRNHVNVQKFLVRRIMRELIQLKHVPKEWHAPLRNSLISLAVSHPDYIRMSPSVKSSCVEDLNQKAYDSMRMLFQQNLKYTNMPESLSTEEIAEHAILASPSFYEQHLTQPSVIDKCKTEVDPCLPESSVELRHFIEIALSFLSSSPHESTADVIGFFKAVVLDTSSKLENAVFAEESASLSSTGNNTNIDERMKSLYQFSSKYMHLDEYEDDCFHTESVKKSYNHEQLKGHYTSMLLTFYNILSVLRFDVKNAIGFSENNNDTKSSPQGTSNEVHPFAAASSLFDYLRLVDMVVSPETEYEMEKLLLHEESFFQHLTSVATNNNISDADGSMGSDYAYLAQKADQKAVHQTYNSLSSLFSSDLSLPEILPSLANQTYPSVLSRAQTTSASPNQSYTPSAFKLHQPITPTKLTETKEASDSISSSAMVNSMIVTAECQHILSELSQMIQKQIVVDFISQHAPNSSKKSVMEKVEEGLARLSHGQLAIPPLQMAQSISHVLFQECRFHSRPSDESQLTSYSFSHALRARHGHPLLISLLWRLLANEVGLSVDVSVSGADSLVFRNGPSTEKLFEWQCNAMGVPVTEDLIDKMKRRQRSLLHQDTLTSAPVAQEPDFAKYLANNFKYTHFDEFRFESSDRLLSIRPFVLDQMSSENVLELDSHDIHEEHQVASTCNSHKIHHHKGKSQPNAPVVIPTHIRSAIAKKSFSIARLFSPSLNEMKEGTELETRVSENQSEMCLLESALISAGINMSMFKASQLEKEKKWGEESRVNSKDSSVNHEKSHIPLISPLHEMENQDDLEMSLKNISQAMVENLTQPKLTLSPLPLGMHLFVNLGQNRSLEKKRVGMAHGKNVSPLPLSLTSSNSNSWRSGVATMSTSSKTTHHPMFDTNDTNDQTNIIHSNRLNEMNPYPSSESVKTVEMTSHAPLDGFTTALVEDPLKNAIPTHILEQRLSEIEAQANSQITSLSDIAATEKRVRTALTAEKKTIAAISPEKADQYNTDRNRVHHNHIDLHNPIPGMSNVSNGGQNLESQKLDQYTEKARRLDTDKSRVHGNAIQDVNNPYPRSQTPWLEEISPAIERDTEILKTTHFERSKMDVDEFLKLDADEQQKARGIFNGDYESATQKENDDKDRLKFSQDKGHIENQKYQYQAPRHHCHGIPENCDLPGCLELAQFRRADQELSPDSELHFEKLKNWFEKNPGQEIYSCVLADGPIGNSSDIKTTPLNQANDVNQLKQSDFSISINSIMEVLTQNGIELQSDSCATTIVPTMESTENSQSSISYYEDYDGLNEFYIKTSQFGKPYHHVAISPVKRSSDIPTFETLELLQILLQDALHADFALNGQVRRQNLRQLAKLLKVATSSESK